MAEDPAGSRAQMCTPLGLSAWAKPMSDPAVPTPWQKAVTRP